MKTIIQKLSLLALMTCFLTPNQADAGFQVTLQANGASETISDQEVLKDTNASVNIIEVNQTVGGVDFHSQFARTNTPGAISFVALQNDINMLVGTLNAGQSASLYVSANGYNTVFSPPDLIAWLSMTVNPSTFSTQTSTTYMAAAYYDETNALSTTATGTMISSLTQTTTTTSMSLGSTTILSDLDQTPYSLNLLITVTKANGLQGRIDANVDSTLRIEYVPEPTSMAIMGLGTLLAGFGVRRRKQKQAQLAA